MDGTVKIKILDDVNGDNKSETKYIATATSAFASFPDHPKWNPQADANQDERVDIEDLAVITANFGKTYP